MNAWPRGVLAIVLACLCAGAYAQVAPKRLSDWLLEQAPSADAYPPGLSWRVPGEAAYQALILRELLAQLSGRDPTVGADPAALGRLSEWLRGLPLTGRVPLSATDARWLEVNPARNPVIEPHHSVVLPSRPRTVTVLTGQGDRCLIGHAPGREALSYLEACDPAAAGQIDHAWIAQPDGRMQRFGVARWNREAQDEPAPGAWLWGPARGSGFPERVSERLIEFLATQGPAPDGGSMALPAPRSPTPKSRGMGTTASDWGGVGLLQTPTARMSSAGTFTFNLTRVQPYTYGNVFVQPFDWLEAGFRYVSLSNVLYGLGAFGGDQTYKDKNLDFKFRLRRESASLPEIAVGFRDAAGTGLFSGEYLVASKRTGNFDWSLGIGWGYLGTRGDFRGVGTRSGNFDQGGNLALSNYFRGPAALFGGVQYQTPWEPLVVKLEFDGNDYRQEPFGQNQPQRSPLNLGLVYRATNWADLSVGFERGNTLMLGLTLRTPLDALGMPKLLDAPRIPIALSRPRQAPDWAATARELATQTGWHVQAIEQHGSDLRVLLDEASAGYWGDRVDRAAAVLHRDAPVTIDRFVLVYGQGGVNMAEHVVDRNAWAVQLTQWLAPSERREVVVARAPGFASPGARLYADARPRFEAALGFDYQQTLGGPDGFVLYQVSAIERMKLRINESTWLQGAVRLGLLNNYEKFRYTAPSDLPRVRTFLREYLVTSRLTIPNLQLTHVGKLGDNQYYSAYAGYLEEMFGGVGAEWLYRPFASRVAFGVDVNAVRQRDFEQKFAFRDYRTVTGHATMYWDTGWENTLAQISVGRYLAKDAGVTVDLSRVFDNGVRVGAFATKTNVTAAQFGEGSFDKGLYVAIPLDALLMRSTTGTANLLWKPLTRDGGAKLARSNPLYGLTATRDERTLSTVPARSQDDVSLPADRREAWQPAAKLPAAQLRLEARPNLAQWAEDKEYEFRLVQALHKQWFRNIGVAFDASRRLDLTLSNARIAPLSRAMGRAARTALRFAPLETREIRITFVEGGEPLVIYSFIDSQRLERFFEGAEDLDSLAGVVTVEYVNPGAREAEPLALVGDLTRDEIPPTLGSVLARPRSIDRIRGDIAAAARTAAGADWWYAAAIGAPLLVSSAALDKRADRFASRHAPDSGLKAAIKIGDAIPWIGFAGAALAALDGSDPRRSRVGYAATEAGAAAFLAATALKYAIGRARPDTGEGPKSFQALTTDDRYNAFPSRHTAVAWAVATPFALEYGADWLYGVAALTNIARTGSRQHWLSDTVAGSLLGYAAGRIFWESSRAQTQQRAAPSVLIDRTGVKLAWEWQ